MVAVKVSGGSRSMALKGAALQNYNTELVHRMTYHQFPMQSLVFLFLKYCLVIEPQI